MSAAFDAYSDNYGAMLAEGLRYSGEDSTFFARGRIEWLARCLSELGEPAESVLDYGCGTGSATPILIEILRAREVVGVDVSRGLLDVARDLHGSANARFMVVGEPHEASFDLAHCNGVFHHIPVADRAAAAKYVWRSLRPGGLFALFENNPWNPGTQLVMRRIRFDRDAIKIAAPAARRLLRSVGFDVLQTGFLFYFPAALGALRPLEPRLARLPLGAQYGILARKPA